MPGVENLTDYRDILIDGATTYGKIPEDRWTLDEWYDPDPTKLGYHVNKVAGLIPKFNFFDNLFFNTSPREAYAMDPHQYQVMEVSQMALDDAGITPATLPHNTAVYMSMRMGEMILTDCENRNIPNSHILTGGSHTTAANRVSFFYDIRGGSMGVEGACSAAMASIHFGAWSLWNKECDAVIAGGINLIWCPHFYASQTNHGYLSSSGTPNPFDSSADGRVRSEAAGVLLLKPLADAIRDGDHVHCVIRGSSLNYHGNNASITLHTPESFKHSMSSVYTMFGIPVDKIKYIEAHATGNADEDVMEAKAIGEVFGQARPKNNPVKIGSVKANVGHSESAAGATSLIKACLMLGNRELYPQANFKELNPEINSEKLNLEVQQKYEKYTGDDNFMVGLNVTSFAGQQCHMVLEEYTPPQKEADPSDLAGWRFGEDESGRMLPIPLSAKSSNALKDVCRQWLEYKNDEDAQIVTGWLATRHDHYVNRMVVMANSTDDLRAKLTGFIAGEQSDFIVEGKARPNFEKPKICFVFPGQGQQWWDMGRHLYAMEPVYRNIIDECDKVWQKCSGYSFLEKNKVFITTGHEDADPTGIDATLAALIAIVANQLALHELIVHWGIKPDMVVGHSLGEASSIYAAGGMTLEECITNIYIRATSQNKVSGTGTMAAARFTPEEADEFCSKHDDIYVACMNSTGNVTLGGGIPTVKRLCAENPTKLKEIRVNSAFHTPHMSPVKEEFVSRLEKIYQHRMARDDTTLYSTVHGDAFQGPYDPAYWWENLGHRVNFVDACKSIFRDHGSDVIFLEIGASATLLGNVRQTAKFMNCTPQGYINCGMRNKDDRVVALKSVGTLHGMGFPIDWTNITRNCGKYIQLPMYPFQGNYYRLESELYRKKRLWQYKQTYKSEHGEVNIQMQPFLADYRLNGKHIVPAAGYVEYLAEMQGEEQVHLRNIKVNAAQEVPQRMRNGTYESIWIIPEIDDKHVVLHQRYKKMQDASADFDQTKVDEDDALMLDIEAIDGACQKILSADDVYDKLSRAGLDYGSQFKVVKEVKVADGEAFGYLSSHTSRHEIIQTVTLDGAFQVTLAAFSKGAPYTVTEVASLKMLTDKMPVEEDLVVYTRLTDWQLETFTCDLSLADYDGNVLLIAEDVRFENAARPTTDAKTCMYTTSWESTKSTDQLSEKPWVILHGRHDATLATSLKKHIAGAATMSKKEFRSSEPQGETNVVYLWNANDVKNAAAEEADHELKAVADLIEDASNFAGQPRLNLWIVTPIQSSSCNLQASYVQGYVRSMSNNKSSLTLRWISVENSEDKDSEASDIIKALMGAVESSEIAVHEDKVLKPVVTRLPETQYIEKTKDWVKSPEEESGFKSVTAGKLDEKEVRIRVRAMSRAHHGLLQCAGVVENIGQGVTSVSIGEAVLGLMCSSVASIATCKEDYVVAKPEKLTWSEASAFGFTTAVAYHTLKDMIRMKAGDTVYVTEAEKPLGQAVVRVAKAFGASVMCSGDPANLTKMFGVVTVVNPTSLAFCKDILQHTGGRGLDIAINTNGETVPQTLIDCTRVAGKVAVMGYSPTRVVADPKVTTCIINARDFIHRRASRLRECVQKAVSLLETGDLVSTTLPTLPITPGEIPHGDMISVDIPEGFLPKNPSLPSLVFRDDATYVVVGGFGNIGLQLATWLARHGAKHIGLVSQHGKQNIQQSYEVEHLKEDHNVEVYEIKANVGNPSEVKMVFETLRQMKAPQVAGLFHAAASMQDVTKHSDDSISRLINSHAKSAEYFHKESTDRALKLDYFVTLSSCAGLFGNPKMATWSAACTVLDQLASLRKRQGLPFLSLQMGSVSGVGYMERNPDAARALEAAGTKPLMIQQYLDTLEMLLQASELPPIVAVVNQVR